MEREERALSSLDPFPRLVSLKPGAAFGPPMWRQGSRHAGHLLILFLGHKQEIGREPVLIWNASVAGGGFAHHATTLA